MRTKNKLWTFYKLYHHINGTDPLYREWRYISAHVRENDQKSWMNSQPVAISLSAKDYTVPKTSRNNLFKLIQVLM